ncbi:MAG: hypothetical protein NXH91_03765 [Phyllobacteriaceae bacterium]|nr:hypothetical protein [Phyllobacteriaceae bacterium]
MSYLALLMVGIGIGVLSGLSTSPVLSVILTSLMATTAAVTTVIAGLSGPPQGPQKSVRTVSVWPLSVLVLGIVAGAVVGAWARTTYTADHFMFSSSVAAYKPPDGTKETIDEWVELGLDQRQVANALFAAHVGIVGDTTVAIAERQAVAATPSLFAVSGEECGRLENARDSGTERLRSAFEAVESAVVARLAGVLSNEELELLLPVTCPENER